MIVGIGCDLERVAALESAAALSAGEAFFSEAERRHAARRRNGAAVLTGYFAAKEAFFKALAGEVRFFWPELEVVHDAPQAARFRFSGELARLVGERGWDVRLSLAHGRGCASALVTVCGPA